VAPGATSTAPASNAALSHGSVGKMGWVVSAGAAIVGAVVAGGLGDLV
jgi:hypothetical protein